jgi:hypothetical protein
MHRKNLQLLQILLEATRQKQLVWRSDSVSGYHARFAGLRCAIRFRHMLAGSEHDSDPMADFVEIMVGMANLKFYTGSEGFSVAQEIIAAGFPELAEEYTAGIQQLDELVARLKSVEPAAVQRSVL